MPPILNTVSLQSGNAKEILPGRTSFFNVFKTLVTWLVEINSCGKGLTQNFTLKKYKSLGITTRNFSFMEGTHSFLSSIMPGPGREFSPHKRLRGKKNHYSNEEKFQVVSSVNLLSQIFLFIGLRGAGVLRCFAFFFLRNRQEVLLLLLKNLTKYKMSCKF